MYWFYYLTGHSLGAGTAVVLASLMRPQYPSLKCFAFSPPGGLCSKEFALATKVSQDCCIILRTPHALFRELYSLVKDQSRGPKNLSIVICDLL